MLFDDRAVLMILPDRHGNGSNEPVNGFTYGRNARPAVCRAHQSACVQMVTMNKRQASFVSRSLAQASGRHSITIDSLINLVTWQKREMDRRQSKVPFKVN